MLKALVVVLLLTSNISLAAPGNRADLNPLLVEAKKLMKYDRSIALPKMIPKTDIQLQQIFCPGKECSVSAVYLRGTVYYDKTIDYKRNIVDRSIIIHEFIHHIQAAKYGYTYECEMWYFKERQAYSLQAKYLRSRGVNASFVNDVTASLKCPK